MGLFVTARSGALPSSLITTLDLAEIRDALVATPPSLTTLAPGWSGPVLQSMLNARNTQPPVSAPVILEPTGHYPERLHARYYYFEFPKQYEEMFPQGTDQERSRVAALDLWISKDPRREGAYMVITSTRHTPLAKEPFASLLDHVRAVDGEASGRLNGSSLFFNDADVFLWLLVRARDMPALTTGVELARIDAVSGTDHTDRVTALSRGVDFDRPAFLVAVAEGEKLGPVGIRFKVIVEKSRMGYQARADGSVAPVAVATHYSDLTDSGLTHERAIADYYYRLLPLVLQLHEEDVKWDTVHRAAEIRAAADALIERYQPFTKELEEAIRQS